MSPQIEELRKVARTQVEGVAISAAALRRFSPDLRGYRRLLGTSALLTILSALVAMAEPWPLKYIFDSVLIGEPLDTPFDSLDQALGDDRTAILAVATGAIVTLAAIQSVLYFYQRILTARVGQEVVLKLRQRVFAHLQRLSLRFHARTQTGDLMTRLSGDIGALRDLIVSSLQALFSSIAILVAYTALMFVLSWRLALVALVLMPVVFVAATIYAGRIRDATRKQRKRESQIASHLSEALSGIHLVQMFTREDEENERLRSMNKRSLRSGMRATRLEAQLYRTTQLSVAVATAATLWVGATEVIAGRLTVGEFVVFMVYLQGFQRPLRRISRTTLRASRAATSLERVTTLLEENPEVEDGDVVAPDFRGGLTFERVSFSYAKDIPVLVGVDLEVEPGQTVAIVGATGAGKSTILALVPRLYDPDEGVISIDGHDVRKFTLKSLRDQISIVPQDAMLFSGSVRENIAYGKPDASDEEIEAAARAAHIHDFVARLPAGYDSEIGERGVTLSGGQRQRVAIARAILRDAPIVLLDEPTTGLDADSEQLVLAALERLLSSRTAIVVAHALATVQSADQIVVMEEGKVVERGTHDQLMQRDGAYRNFYEIQHSGASSPADAGERRRSVRSR